MFFNKIESWTKKQLLAITIICYLVYFAVVVLSPTITIMIKYQVFKHSEQMRNITGFGIIVIVICGLASYIFVKKVTSKLPQTSTSQRKLKFAIETIFDCLPLAICLYAMFAVRDDLALAFSTMKICMWYFLVGILFNGLFIKFIDAEWKIREDALKNKEIAKREGVV